MLKQDKSQILKSAKAIDNLLIISNKAFYDTKRNEYLTDLLAIEVILGSLQFKYKAQSIYRTVILGFLAAGSILTKVSGVYHTKKSTSRDSVLCVWCHL